MYFDDNAIDIQTLKQRSFNQRWATVPENVIPLTAADPDFPSAPEIATAICSYSEKRIFSYGPAEGLAPFRETIARTMLQKRNIRTSKDLILPVDSAAQAIFIIAKYCLQPGDEAIIFDPVDFLFKKSIEAAGAKPVLFPIHVQTGQFDITLLQRSITPRTKLLCICNPLNPTGKVFTREELTQLGEVALEHNLWIMSDEIWSDIIFPGKNFTSIAAISPALAARTLTVYGFSKSFALAGLRVGFIIAPNEKVYEEIVQTSLVRTTAYGVSTLSQIAAQTAFEKCWYWVENFIQHLTTMRDYAVNRLNSMKSVTCHVPEGCYLVFPNISATKKTSTEIANYLLQTAKVAVVPGASQWFGPGANGHIRICISTSHNILEEAFDRMEKAFQKI